MCSHVYRTVSFTDGKNEICDWWWLLYQTKTVWYFMLKIYFRCFHCTGRCICFQPVSTIRDFVWLNVSIPSGGCNRPQQPWVLWKLNIYILNTKARMAVLQNVVFIIMDCPPHNCWLFVNNNNVVNNNVL